MRAMEVLDACMRPDPMQAALTMAISIENLQDALATQPTLPSAEQTQRVQQHSTLTEAIFRCFGVVKEDLLDIVRLHNDRDATQGPERNRECRRILHLAGALIDKMAPRATRPGLSALGAAKSIIEGARDENARIGKAMSTVVAPPPAPPCCWPMETKPLASKKDAPVTTPLVVRIANAQGLSMGIYVLRDNRETPYAIPSPAAANKVKISHKRVQKALVKVMQQLPGIQNAMD